MNFDLESKFYLSGKTFIYWKLVNSISTQYFIPRNFNFQNFIFMFFWQKNYDMDLHHISTIRYTIQEVWTDKTFILYTRERMLWFEQMNCFTSMMANSFFLTNCICRYQQILFFLLHDLEQQFQFLKPANFRH